jgi:two-component system, OmpR family, response regulator
MRILIIEDDYKIANAIKKGLEQESYACDVAFDGEDGIGFAMTVDYDLIIIDRMLPDSVDGIGICKAIRKKGKKVPILILTAKDKIEDRVEGLNAGADDYLVKPFAFEELLARVKALFRRPNQNLGAILKVNDLILDTLKFEARRGKKKIDLSLTEFKLLEYLMRNPGRILTKDNIIEHVWDYNADILPNTVEVYVGYLRNKIDKPFLGPNLIQTLRGFGYKIGVKS